MCSIHIKSLFEKKGFHKILPMSGLAETLLAIYNAGNHSVTLGWILCQIMNGAWLYFFLFYLSFFRFTHQKG